MKDSNNLFNEYVTVTRVAKSAGAEINHLFIAASLSGIPIYFVNQSTKTLRYLPLEYRSARFLSFKKIKRFFNIGEVIESFHKGDFLELRSIRALDFLVKGILNERELFLGRAGGDYYLAGEAAVFATKLSWLSANFYLNTFHVVTLEHVYFSAKDFKALGEAVREYFPNESNDATDKQKTQEQSKQSQRELIFLRWLAGQETEQVALMKKDDVWEELQKLDHALFSVESKNFFRDQKIITFKSGRKPKGSD
jgi:hypothetical protein